MGSSLKPRGGDVTAPQRHPQTTPNHSPQPPSSLPAPHSGLLSPPLSPWGGTKSQGHLPLAHKPSVPPPTPIPAGIRIRILNSILQPNEIPEKFITPVRGGALHPPVGSPHPPAGSLHPLSPLTCTAAPGQVRISSSSAKNAPPLAQHRSPGHLQPPSPVPPPQTVPTELSRPPLRPPAPVGSTFAGSGARRAVRRVRFSSSGRKNRIKS